MWRGFILENEITIYYKEDIPSMMFSKIAMPLGIKYATFLQGG